MNSTGKKIIRTAKIAITYLKYLAVPLDWLLFPVTILSLSWFRLVKYLGVSRFPVTRKLFYKIGVTPVVKHYYEPLFDIKQLSKPLNTDRQLPAINFNTENQIKLIKQFTYQKELAGLPLYKPDRKQPRGYFYHNGSFPSGDAEFYYSLIRHIKPQKILEVGSGFSTLLALEAIKTNTSGTELICIEPYEFSWLEELGIKVIRKKVELLPVEFFTQLQENDILFIDSSHVIRPQGDVVQEILEILPRLAKGVYVHFHDIFSPLDYPATWLTHDFRLWNEQYMLEAFLSHNPDFEIVGSLTYMSLYHRDVLNKAFPVMAADSKRTPGSFWLKKIN